MSSKVVKFPNFFRPAMQQDKPCLILILPIVRVKRECPKVQELRRQSKLLREHFKPKCGM